jgi:short subunit dehydrogenase-like uncharacterized protein
MEVKGMERSNFIKLLEEYKNKALQEQGKEAKASASLLISKDLKTAISELEKASIAVNEGFKKISEEIGTIAAQNALDSYYGSFCYSSPSTHIMENVLSCLSQKIYKTTAYERKKSEIVTKFDAAIRAAKATRSTAKLKELADALGIETPSIEVTPSVSATVDTEFVKEKIKSVLLLN